MLSSVVFLQAFYLQQKIAVYCINKEEPETLVLVRNIAKLFVFPDTVIGTESW